MKKQIKTLFMLGFISLTLLGCSTNSSDSTPISKNVLIHFSKDNVIEKKLYFFNNNKDIPYLDINESINTFFDSEQFSVSKENDIFKILNKKTSSNLFINVNGKITYEDLLKFKENEAFSDGCYLDDFRRSNLLCQKITDKSSYKKPNEYQIDLNKFGFKPYLYEGKYYLPIDIFYPLINHSYGMLYYDAKGEIYLYSKNNDLISSISKKTSYDNAKEFFTHCYNEFALTIELYYGLKGYVRVYRNNQKEHKYLPNGVLEEFANYKDKIINSKDLTEFDTNLVNMLNLTLADGGHTFINEVSLGSLLKNIPLSEEETYLNNLLSNGYDQREISKDKESYDYSTYVYDSDDDDKYDIGYITFDKFLSSKDKEHATIQDIFRGDEGANNSLNRNAEKYDSENYDIKDIIIDLTLNTGGHIDALGFILSWICGGVAKETLKSTNGDALSTYSYKYDVNGDNFYDSKDYLPNDVNVYLLMSPITYSAANSLAFSSKLFNKENPKLNPIKFIGMQSGGGACSIDENFFLPTGLSFTLSSINTRVDPNSTNISYENGVLPDDGLKIDQFNNLFNRTQKNGINELVISKRK